MAEASAAAEHLALVFTQAGMQRMAARVWCAVVFADQETITAREIADQLGVSAGAVSGALGTLLTGGLIERVPAPGSRQNHYAFPPGAWARLATQRDQLVRQIQQAAEEGVKAMGEDSVAGRRLSEMRDFYAYLEQELPALIDRWYEQRGSG